MTLEKALRQLAARADKPGAETTDDLACLAREVEVIGEAVLDSISDVAMPLLQVLLATDSAAAGTLPCARALPTRTLASWPPAHMHTCRVHRSSFVARSGDSRADFAHPAAPTTVSDRQGHGITQRFHGTS